MPTLSSFTPAAWLINPSAKSFPTYQALVHNLVPDQRAVISQESTDRFLSLGSPRHQTAEDLLPQILFQNGLLAREGNGYEFDRQLYEKAGFDAMTQGIRILYEANAFAWTTHIDSCRAAMLAGAERCMQRNLAVVVGAGRCFDVPLQELAVQFERVKLIDIDLAAMTEARRALPQALRPRVILQPMDVAACTFRYLKTMKSIIDKSRHHSTALPEMALATSSFTIPEKIPFTEPYEGTPADLLISDMIMTQLPYFLFAGVASLFSEKFTNFKNPLRDSGFHLALSHLTYRVQSSHLEQVSRHGRRAVVITDLSETALERGSAGNVQPASQERMQIDRLRFRQGLQDNFSEMVEQTWAWNRIWPTESVGSCGVTNRVVSLQMKSSLAS